MARFSGRVVWVTGSSRGIGAATARGFAAEGARVALHGRDSAALAETEAGIIGAGGSAASFTGDVTEFRDIEAMRADIEERLGPIDILVANAGANLTPPAPLEEIPEDGWRATVETNLTATFLTLKCVLPGMKARKRGSIITVSSAAARRPNARSPIAYAAAKAGVVLLTQDAAQQAGPYGVRVNCIAPETILTEGNRQRIPEDIQKTLADMHPLQRLGMPDDIARTALYLASEESSWITGAVIDVNGGAV